MTKTIKNIAIYATFIASLYLATIFVYRNIILPYPEDVKKVVSQIEPASAPTIETLGQYGDMFGSLNIIFTAISAFLVFISLIYQTSTTQKESYRGYKRDIEANFFSMLGKIGEIQKSIDIRSPRDNEEHDILISTEAFFATWETIYI